MTNLGSIVNIAIQELEVLFLEEGYVPLATEISGMIDVRDGISGLLYDTTIASLESNNYEVLDPGTQNAVVISRGLMKLAIPLSFIAMSAAFTLAERAWNHYRPQRQNTSEAFV